MTTQNIYRSVGTPVVFRGTGGGDILWTPQSIATGSGRISNVWDRGAGNLPVRYKWRCSTRWVATPAAYDALRLYLIGSSAAADPTVTDGNITFGDAGLASEDVLVANCLCFGSVVVDATPADVLYVSSGIVLLYDRYIGIAGWNGSATKALTGTVGDHILSFTPMPDDIESAA